MILYLERPLNWQSQLTDRTTMEVFYMTNFIIRLFVKDYKNISDPVVRRRYGRVSAVTGILCNLLLFCAKTVIGILAGSVAITADAVNNLSDAGSSVITLVGFRLSAKPADKEHPYGHERMEYVSGLFVSVVILLLGLELVKSSVEKIISPVPIQFSWAVIVVLALSIGLKLWLGLFYRSIGRRIDSKTLTAASADSMNDVASTSAVLVATAFTELTGIQIDGYMGLGVAVFIIISGVKLIRETMNPLLGEAPDEKFLEKIEEKLKGYEGILGFHDLVIHNYGPGCCFATVHVELPAEWNILESHHIIDEIEKDFSTELGIQMVIHLDPVVTGDERLDRVKADIESILKDIDPSLSMHDFRASFAENRPKLIFEVTVPPSCREDDEELISRIRNAIRHYDPEYHSVITIDRNYISSTHEER